MSAALLYEWRRMTSIKSTYVFAGLFLVFAGIVAFLVYQVLSGGIAGAEGSGGPTQTIPLGDVMIAGTNFLSAIFVTTLAAQSFGHEYRYGMIRLTHGEFPRRWIIYTAKLIMVLAWVLVLYLLSIVVSYLVVRLIGGSVESFTAETWWQLVRAGLFLLGYCVLAFTITVLTRNLVLGVVIPLLLGAVVEPLATAGLSDRLPWLPKFFPVSAGNAFVTGGDTMLQGGLIFLAWVVGLIIASYVIFERRDA